MHRHIVITSAVGFVVALGMIGALSAQQAPSAQQASAPPMIFDVNFVRPASQTGQTKVVQDNIGDRNLELKQYGLHESCLLTSGTPGSETTPFSVWSGECERPFQQLA